MKSSILSFAVAVSLFLQLQAAPAQETNKPTARQLLNEVISQLPKEQLAITGDILVRKRGGDIARELKFEMDLALGSNPPTASYLIMDNFGRELEKLTVRRQPGKDVVFDYGTGAAAAKKLPNIFEEIQGTDISWSDLTLAFLWWPDARIVGMDSVKTLDCYVVEVSCPLNIESNKTIGISGRVLDPYSKVRVWIVDKYRAMIKAEGYDDKAKLVRKLEATSFQKINERQMIKWLIVEAPSTGHNTKIIFREVVGEHDNAKDGKNAETTILEPSKLSDAPTAVTQ